MYACPTYVHVARQVKNKKINFHVLRKGWSGQSSPPKINYEWHKKKHLIWIKMTLGHCQMMDIVKLGIKILILCKLLRKLTLFAHAQVKISTFSNFVKGQKVGGLWNLNFLHTLAYMAQYKLLYVCPQPIHLWCCSFFITDSWAGIKICCPTTIYNIIGCWTLWEIEILVWWLTGWFWKIVFCLILE